MCSSDLLVGWLARIEWLMAGWLLLSSIDFLRPMHLPELLLALKWAPLFCAGMLFRLLWQRGMSRQRYLLLWWCHFLVLGRATVPQELWDNGAGWERMITAALLTAFFGVFWLIATRRWVMRASPLTLWAGLLTYPVYLLHQNIGYMLLERLRPLWPSFTGRLALVMALVCAALGLLAGAGRLDQVVLLVTLVFWLGAGMLASALCVNSKSAAGLTFALLASAGFMSLLLAALLSWMLPKFGWNQAAVDQRLGPLLGWESPLMAFMSSADGFDRSTS